ncbi:MAG: HNH endonuclease family protein [Thermoleophilia bacterium]
MFIHAKEEEFRDLKVKWKQLVDTLFGVNEKPLRFLRYFIFANYDIDRLKEDEIYDWFVKNEKFCGYEAEPIRFVNKLLEASNSYANYLKGKDRYGNPNRFLENIRFLSGAARQHLILLLAADNLSDDAFSYLCHHVENLFFATIITREPTKEFERKFAQWAKELRGITNLEDLKDFLLKNFEPTKRDLTARFDLAFRELDASFIQQYRMKYLLGKMTQYVNEQAYGSAAEEKLETFVCSNVEIEHILPQSPDEEVIAEFDISMPEAALYINRLGNLCLIEKPLNASLGNKPFSQKKVVYPKSKFLLTKGIAEKIVIGKNTSVDRAVKQIEPFLEWTSSMIEKRQVSLGELAKLVWEMPVTV